MVKSVATNQVQIDEKVCLLAQEIRSVLLAVESFYDSLQSQKLFRNVIFHKQKVKLENFDDIYIPHLCWVEYIGKKRVYLEWEQIADILNRANASIDERILHIKLHHEFQRLHLEVKSAVNQLKDSIQLSQNFLEMLKNQGISLKMFNKF